MSYAGRTKYDEPGKARAYAARSAKRDAEEWTLLSRLLDDLPQPPGSALDVPCGTGRIAEQLMGRGIPTRAADLSPAMRAEAERRLSGKPHFLGLETIDLEAVPADATPADLVVCFRFLHHLPDAAHRERVLRGLRALTQGTLLLSFHHPVSFHNLSRGIRRLFTRRRGDRYTLSKKELREEAAAAGLRMVDARGLAAYRRELWVAVLRPQ